MLKVTTNYRCLHLLPERERRKRAARALCGKKQYKVKWKLVKAEAVESIPLCQACRDAVLVILATHRRLAK
jgi:hypothetical protein